MILKKVIVGLGNKGEEYQHTRHNVGFMVVDQLAKNFSVKFKEENQYYECAKKHENGQDIYLIKPLTFMNLSGHAIKNFIHKHEIDLKDLLVIYDDVDLALGKIRVRPCGGTGGHNGVASIVDELGAKNFARLRIGIDGRKHGDLSGYVLSPFKKNEKDSLEKILTLAENIAIDFLTINVEALMAKYN